HFRDKKSLPNVPIPCSLGSVRGSLCLAFATTSVLVISGVTVRAQALAPSTLNLPSHDQKPVNDIVQVITSKSPQVVTSKSPQVVTSKSPQVVTKKPEPGTRNRPTQPPPKGPAQ